MQLITISGIRFVGIAFLLSIVLMIYYTISKIKFYNLEYDMVGHVANDFPLSIVFVESNITRISPTGTVSWREFITKEVALESTNYSIAQSWIKQLKICSPRQKNNSDPCDLQEMDLNFLSKWKKNLITDISCDSEANSKVRIILLASSPSFKLSNTSINRYIAMILLISRDIAISMVQ